MVRTLRGPALVLLGLIGAARAAAAQTPAAVLEREAARAPVVRLRAEGVRVTGRLIALSGGEATLATAAGSRPVPLAGIDSVWVRGRSTRTGALAGASVGAVLTAVFVGLVADGLCEVDCDNAGLKGAVVGFGIGAAGGAIAGAAIGAAIPRWRLRFP